MSINPISFYVACDNLSRALEEVESTFSPFDTLPLDSGDFIALEVIEGGKGNSSSAPNPKPKGEP